MSASRTELDELRAEVDALRRERDRSTELASRLIAGFGESFRRELRLRKRSMPDGPDVLRIDSAASVLMPLGIKKQTVVLEPSAVARRLEATIFSAAPSDSVMLELAVVGADAENQTLVRLVAGVEKVLLEIGPAPEPVRCDVRRVNGEPCVARLSIADAEAAPGRVNRPDLAMESLRRRAAKGVLWQAQELIEEGLVRRAVESATANASDTERPALDLLRANLVRHDERTWLSYVNRYVARFGIAPVELSRASADRSGKYLGLQASAPPVTGGPLVSVILPAFNAGRTLEQAASSILRQTWTNLELFIIDDCSHDDTWRIARQLAGSDTRVRVHRNASNVGPYVSKNLVLAAAAGTYVTCQDADDWAHPQRLECQIRAMTEGARARASVGGMIRLDDSGLFGFTRVSRLSDDGALRLAHVTCMLDAEFMRRYVGYWDSVRFGADGEMFERLRHILGDEFRYLRQLSLFSLDTPGSLTNDAVHGISKRTGPSPVRRAYRDSWRRWHASLTPDGAFVQFPPIDRPFFAPDESVVAAASISLVVADARHDMRQMQRSAVAK